jgi:hypothetical protein
MKTANKDEKDEYTREAGPARRRLLARVGVQEASQGSVCMAAFAMVSSNFQKLVAFSSHGFYLPPFEVRSGS